VNAIAKNSQSATFIPADPEVFATFIEYYGFDHFLKKTVPMIDLTDDRYGDAIDEAIDRDNVDYDNTRFSVRRAFNLLVRDLMDEGLSRDEAIEELSEDGYVIPVHTAMYYSVDAGDADIERLSALIRNRARRILRRGAN